MTINEPSDSTQHRLIPIEHFATCLIDGKTRKEIAGLYPGTGVYYLERFERYLKEHHDMDMKAYVIQYGGINWPKCLESGRDVGYKTGCGKGLIVRRYAHHAGVTMRTNAATKANAERMSVERRGEGNPMHGREAWNKGLTAETDATMAVIAEHMRNRPPPSAATLEKMRQASLGQKRHTTPHTAESKHKMRLATARRWAEGGFAHGDNSIHRAMRAFLDTLSLTDPYVAEYQVEYYSLDFAFPKARVAIECDGDYFHSNPAFYPNGPKTSTQKRNWARDGHRNAELAELGWTVIHVWECDINAGSFKEPLQCRLSESGLLSPSVESAA